jgi:glycosyltransferase involved in cell wall biosynthesis
MSRPTRVLELRSVRGTGGGPEKTILLGAAQSDPAKCHVTVCYIRDVRDQIFAVDDRAAGMGVDYVEITERNSFDPAVWSALRDLITRRNIEIVHAHDYKTDLLAWLLHRWHDVAVLATAHGWTGHSWRERRLYYPADKWLLARLPRVIAVSSDIRNEIVRYGARPEAVSVLLNGIDHLAFRREPQREAEARAAWGFSSADVVLGAVGRLEPQKRFDLLIEAFARVARHVPEARLAIAGDGSKRLELQAQIDRAGIGAVCRLTGHVTDIPLFHHALDLFVQSSDYEGTPNAVLEAMAFETPLVATSAGGTGELVRDGIDGLVIPTGDADALERAIHRSLTDLIGRLDRAASARQRVSTELSFRSRTQKLERIYGEIADSLATLSRSRPEAA